MCGLEVTMTRLRSRYPPWALARPSPAQDPEASAVRLEAEEDWGGTMGDCEGAKYEILV